MIEINLGLVLSLLFVFQVNADRVGEAGNQGFSETGSGAVGQVYRDENSVARITNCDTVLCNEIAKVDGKRIIEVDGALLQLPAYDPNKDVGNMPLFISGILPDGTHAALVGPCNLDKVKNFSVISRIDDPYCRWLKSSDPYPCDAKNMVKEFKRKGFVLANKKVAFDVTIELKGNARLPEGSRPGNLTLDKSMRKTLSTGHPPDSRWGDNCYYHFKKK